MQKISPTIIAAVCCLLSGFCKPAEAQGLSGWTGATYVAVSGHNFGKDWSCDANRLMPFDRAWDPSADNMSASAGDPTASGDASATSSGTVRLTMHYHRRIASESIYQHTDPEAANPDGLDSDPVSGSTRVIAVLKRCHCDWQGTTGAFDWNLGTASGPSVVTSDTNTTTDSISGSEGVSANDRNTHTVREYVTCKVQQADASYTVLEGNNYNTYQDYVLSFDEQMSASIAPNVCQPYPYSQFMHVEIQISMDAFGSH